jgi:hypothetical protein
MSKARLVAMARMFGITVALLLGLSCSGLAQNVPECKAVIDVTSPGKVQDCYLSRGFLRRHGVTWKNSGSSVIDIIFVDSPFEAVTWKIPANGGKRKSGNIRSDASAGDHFYTIEVEGSINIKSNPRIIIK